MSRFFALFVRVCAEERFLLALSEFARLLSRHRATWHMTISTVSASFQSILFHCDITDAVAKNDLLHRWITDAALRRDPTLVQNNHWVNFPWQTPFTIFSKGTNRPLTWTVFKRCSHTDVCDVLLDRVCFFVRISALNSLIGRFSSFIHAICETTYKPLHARGNHKPQTLTFWNWKCFLLYSPWDELWNGRETELAHRLHACVKDAKSTRTVNWVISPHCFLLAQDRSCINGEKANFNVLMLKMFVAYCTVVHNSLKMRT